MCVCGVISNRLVCLVWGVYKDRYTGTRPNIQQNKRSLSIEQKFISNSSLAIVQALSHHDTRNPCPATEARRVAGRDDTCNGRALRVFLRAVDNGPVNMCLHTCVCIHVFIYMYLFVIGKVAGDIPVAAAFAAAFVAAAAAAGSSGRRAGSTA